ncbi:cytidylate kinase family protein [Candidatus Micrarchaeota archaeon]|nr:cytidylate kinase family protein [Candidatus Micrarchaeota archaeon]
MIITVSGQPGAGSTTLAKQVAKTLHYRLLTMGEIHKRIAKQHGMAIKEYWEHQRKNPTAEKRFHNELDAYQKREAKRGNIVINGKLSAFKIPNADLKILIVASLRERAKRTVKRDGGPIKSAMAAIKKRETIERRDWKKMYGFDYIADKRYYDFVIDTTKLNEKQTNNVVLDIISKVKKR